MSNEKLVDLPSAVFLDGTEIYYAVQMGVDVKVTGSLLNTFFITATSSVGGLPVAGVKGRRLFVTDASTNTFATVVASGGAFNVPVFDDGTNWRIG